MRTFFSSCADNGSHSCRTSRTNVINPTIRCRFVRPICHSISVALVMAATISSRRKTCQRADELVGAEWPLRRVCMGAGEPGSWLTGKRERSVVEKRKGRGVIHAPAIDKNRYAQKIICVGCEVCFRLSRDAKAEVRSPERCVGQKRHSAEQSRRASHRVLPGDARLVAAPWP